MEDNWVAKEFMSAAYNPAYLKPEENAENKNKLLPAKDNYQWAPTSEELELEEPNHEAELIAMIEEVVEVSGDNADDQW